MLVQFVKYKKLHLEAKAPVAAREGDAGLDLYATEVRVNHKTRTVEYGTGLAFEIPQGYVGLLFPRSSCTKTAMRLANSVGVIDSSFRGEVRLVFDCLPNEQGLYEVGDRVGQLIIMPYPKVHMIESDFLNSSTRGGGGFGSTGR